MSAGTEPAARQDHGGAPAATGLKVLQLARATIDGGFDYHREISQAFAEPGDSVLSAFVRNRLPAATVRRYAGKVRLLRAERRRWLKQPLLAAWRLRRYAAGRPFDLGLCHHFVAFRIGVWLRRWGKVRRLVLVIHDFHYFAENDRHGKRRRRFLLRHLAARDVRVVAVSDALARHLRETLPQLPPERLSVIHNAIDAEALRRDALPPASARRLLELKGDGPVIGTIGRLIDYKAQHELIEAFAAARASEPALLHDVLLVIVGRGPNRQALEQRISRLGLQRQVRLVGFLPQAARYLRAFDLFVLPSHNEPFGLVLLEAMALRVAVLAADSGAAPEILDRPASLYPTGDVAALAQALASLLRQPERRHELAAAGQRRLHDRFDVTAYRRHYRELARAEASRRGR